MKRTFYALEFLNTLKGCLPDQKFRPGSPEEIIRQAETVYFDWDGDRGEDVLMLKSDAFDQDITCTKEDFVKFIKRAVERSYGAAPTIFGRIPDEVTNVVFDCGGSRIYVWSGSPVEAAEPKPCRCDITALMAYGCQCGAIETERKVVS